MKETRGKRQETRGKNYDRKATIVLCHATFKQETVIDIDAILALRLELWLVKLTDDYE